MCLRLLFFAFFWINHAENLAGSLVSCCHIRKLCSNANGVLSVGINQCTVGPRKAFLGVVYLVPEGVLFPISFRVRLFVDAVGGFQIIRHCSFEASLGFLAYRRSTKIDWEDVCCIRWFPYKGTIGDFLGTL